MKPVSASLCVIAAASWTAFAAVEQTCESRAASNVESASLLQHRGQVKPLKGSENLNEEASPISIRVPRGGNEKAANIGSEEAVKRWRLWPAEIEEMGTQKPKEPESWSRALMLGLRRSMLLTQFSRQVRGGRCENDSIKWHDCMAKGSVNGTKLSDACATTNKCDMKEISGTPEKMCALAKLIAFCTHEQGCIGEKITDYGGARRDFRQDCEDIKKSSITEKKTGHDEGLELMLACDANCNHAQSTLLGTFVVAVMALAYFAA